MQRNEIHFVTGATGFIGRNLVIRLCKEGHRVFALVREQPNTPLHITEATFLKSVGLPAEAVTCVFGDILKADLGIDIEIKQLFLNSSMTMWHLAANLSFSPSQKDVVYRTNSLGSQNAVIFANSYAKKYIHMSTAYVCGDFKSTFFEDSLNVRQSFRNEYERTKYIGESIVHEKCTVPFIVFRPSIVIGDAYEGKAEGCTFGYYRFGFMLHILKRWAVFNLDKKSFSGYLLKLLGSTATKNGVKLPWLVIPYPKAARVNMIPVDYVISTMIEIERTKKISQVNTFHITQEIETESLFVLTSAIEDLGIEGVHYLKLPPSLFTILLRILYYVLYPLQSYTKSVYWYIPYVTSNYHFDRKNVQQFCSAPPPQITREFLKRINAYAETSVFSRIELEMLKE